MDKHWGFFTVIAIAWFPTAVFAEGRSFTIRNETGASISCEMVDPANVRGNAIGIDSGQEKDISNTWRKAGEKSDHVANMIDCAASKGKNVFFNGDTGKIQSGSLTLTRDTNNKNKFIIRK